MTSSSISIQDSSCGSCHRIISTTRIFAETAISIKTDWWTGHDRIKKISSLSSVTSIAIRYRFYRTCDPQCLSRRAENHTAITCGSSLLPVDILVGPPTEYSIIVIPAKEGGNPFSLFITFFLWFQTPKMATVPKFYLPTGSRGMRRSSSKASRTLGTWKKKWRVLVGSACVLPIHIRDCI